jgi:stage II sporulation protein AA (anti-sigma F factor antagonist)
MVNPHHRSGRGRLAPETPGCALFGTRQSSRSAWRQPKPLVARKTRQALQQILKNLYLTPNSGTILPDDTSSEADCRGHAVRLSVTGELDIATVDSLNDMAIGALRLPVKVLILDFFGVTFCGAAGIGALVKIQRAAAEAGTRLVLSGVQPPVRRVLELVGLGAMIPVVGTFRAKPGGTPKDSIEPKPPRTLLAA